MSHSPLNTEMQELSDRNKEFGDKSTQLFIFLSFAILGAVTVRSSPSLGTSQTLAVSGAMGWWVWAFYPVLLGVLPLKEFGWQKPRWYGFIRWLKVLLLWIAVAFIVCGAFQFTRAI